jgi:decaprenylphospho-beta-D-ribofuranose 2-oxidase
MTMVVEKQPDSLQGHVQEITGYDEIHIVKGMVYEPSSWAQLGRFLRRLSAEPARHRITFRAGGQAVDSQALGTDVVIQLDAPEMSRIGEPVHDARGYHVTVGAAATWGAILAKVAATGHLPYSVVTTSHATAGGTVSSDCLSRCSPISGREGKHVLAFTMLTLDGRAITCDRDDPTPEIRELFHAVIGGLGYLGVITELTLELRPPLAGWKPGRRICVTTRVDKQFLETTWKGFLPALRERSGTEEPEPHGFFAHVADAAISLVRAEPEPVKVAWDAVSSGAWFAFGGVEALVFRSRFALDLPLDPMPLYQRASKVYTMLCQGMCNSTLAELGESAMFALHPAGVYVDDLADFTFFMENQFTPMKQAANAHGWRLNTIQQTFVLPATVTSHDPAGASVAERFLEKIRETVSGDSVLPEFLAPMRPTLIDVLYLPADDFLLSANRGLDGYAVTITFAERDGVGWDTLKEKLRALSEVCLALGGRVHLVKNVEADSRVLHEMYGDAFAGFLALKAKYDPRGMLENEFFDRVFGEPEQTAPG